MSNPLDQTETKIVYLKRTGKYEIEKPYTTAFLVDHIPGAKVDNHEWDFVPTKINNIRNQERPQLDVHGFQYVNWRTSLCKDEFESSEIITTKYYAELAQMLKENFPHYKKVAFFDHVVRRRDACFPAAKGASTTEAQPFQYAHVDFTEHGAILKLENSLGDSATERLKLKCDVLNVWKLLNDKPTRDWPLAFCYWSSIDRENDLINNDIVYTRGLGENCFLQRNPNHKWSYLKGQGPEELAVFRNVRINDASAPLGFHCAFHDPLADASDALRESIEVRLAAFY